jgi:PKD repeat protein/acetyl esterase/lipase
MKLIHVLFTFFFVQTLMAQELYDVMRYRYAIFDEVTVTSNIQYGQAPQWVWPYTNEKLYLDVYQPLNDVNTNRPLIIFAHAGGFLNGSKTVDNMIAICDSFARKGYVTASIDYRKGFNPLDAESAERAVYRGIQDGKAAVRFFKNNANLYGIDTNFVYFGGMSAGGFISLHVAYMDLESERPNSTYGGGTVNDLGCLDCAGNNYPQSSKIRAGINYWGAIQDTLNIAPNDTPLLLMHGTTDPTVPYEYGHPFGLFTLPNVYGSKPVRERLENVGVYHEMYISERPGLHMLDGSSNGTFNSPPISFWYDTLLPRTTDFLVKMTKPTPSIIGSDSLFLCYEQPINVALNGDDSHYYKWILFSDTDTVELNNHSNHLIKNIPNAGHYRLASIAFNEVVCSSDTLWFNIIKNNPLYAQFDHEISTESNVQFTNTSSNYTSCLWDFGDGTTSNEINPQHVYTTNGTYTVLLTIFDSFGCSNTNIQTLVIDHLSAMHHETIHFSVYPNPFNETITIQNEDNQLISGQVLTIQGQEIYELFHIENTSSYSINTENWVKGIYLLQLVDYKGNKHILKIKK